MIEERLDRIEAHMLQLIKMVAETNKVMNSFSVRMDRLEQRFDRQEQKFEQEQALSAKRHKELLKETRNNSVEIDYVRNEVSKHDMAIHKLETSN
ncbi:hypothetical protein [Radiobacillus sp. PE A8.2]|uniref:hypothetical protein n=1 Tax=Radiobacillus sp. PE A8.2 TaxID=3380349 RepID=UPI00388DDF5A